MGKRLRTAILGCGNFAARHAGILVNLPDIELVAFCNRTPQKAEQYSRQYTDGRGQVFTDHHAMFDAMELDLVYINLPPFAHTDEVMVAAQHGTHVFVEKPIALDSALAWRMVEAVETAGVKSQVGFMFRFGAAVEHLKQALDSGEAGPPTMMLGRYFCNSLHSWWWRQRDKAGGQIVEQAIHLFDVMRYLLGAPATVYATWANLLHRDVPDYTVEDVSSTVVTFANGAIGTIAATNTAIPGRWLESYWVVTQRLTAEFQNSNNATFARTDRPGEVSLSVTAQTNTYLNETLDLIAAIRDDRPTRTPMREGALSLDLVLAAARSADSGQPVTLIPVPG
jgi:predicted dehydrogenase